MKTTYENNITYSGQSGYVYILTNTKNNKYYYGSGQGNPEDPEKPYVTSSKNPELKEAIADGEIDRHILAFDDLSACRVIEKKYIDDMDAANDPNSYNQSNFTGAKTNKVSDFGEANRIATEMRETQSYNGIKAKIVKLKKIGNKLDPSDPLYDLEFLQPRKIVESGDHISLISTIIDDAHGQIETLEQKLTSVILENRKIGSRVKNQLIGGRHTFKGTLRAEYGTKLRVLFIPASIHSHWSDDFVEDIALAHNGRSAIKTLESSLDDIAFRIVRKITTLNISKDSSQIKVMKDSFNLTSKQRATVTRIVNKELDRIEHEKTKPEHFIDYKKGTDARDEIDDKIKKLNEDPHTFAKLYSTGKSALGDDIIKLITQFYDGKKNLKHIALYLYHPSIPAKKKYESKYEKDFKNTKKFMLQHKGLNLESFKIIPMPMEEKK